MENPRVTTITIVPGPSMVNFSGSMHGGELLKLLDQVASATSRRYSRGYCVTAKVLAVEYFDPISIGDLVTCTGTITSVGRTSMVVDIEVKSESMYTGEIVPTNKAQFIMVHMVDGRSSPVPKLEAWVK
jgi:uncharacterized protein (TIGR00369 family)